MPYPNSTEEIALEYPITVAGAQVSVVQMRRPTVRDRILFDKDQGSEVEKELSMMARLCDMDPDQMMDLDAADYDRVQEQFTAFRSRSQSGNSKEQ